MNESGYTATILCDAAALPAAAAMQDILAAAEAAAAAALPERRLAQVTCELRQGSGPDEAALEIGLAGAAEDRGSQLAALCFHLLQRLPARGIVWPGSRTVLPRDAFLATLAAEFGAVPASGPAAACADRIHPRRPVRPAQPQAPRRPRPVDEATRLRATLRRAATPEELRAAKLEAAAQQAEAGAMRLRVASLAAGLSSLLIFFSSSGATAAARAIF
ncbi:hypothetical protein [Roseivivax sp. CAU 1761]